MAVEQAVKNTQKEERARAAKREKQLVEKAEAEKIESAKKMLSDGLSEELVSKYSGLSLEEIKKL